MGGRIGPVAEPEANPRVVEIRVMGTATPKSCKGFSKRIPLNAGFLAHPSDCQARKGVVTNPNLRR